MGILRRKDRTIKDINTIKEIVSKCQVVRVAMCKDNVPYLVPLNYGYEFSDKGELILYCNCSTIGKKLDILEENPNVFIEIDNKKHIIENDTSCDHDFEYYSIMSAGRVEFVHNIYDKIHGLNKITGNYTSKNSTNEFKNEALNKIFLLKITCTNLSAKTCTR